MCDYSHEPWMGTTVQYIHTHTSTLKSVPSAFVVHVQLVCTVTNSSLHVNICRGVHVDPCGLQNSYHVDPHGPLRLHTLWSACWHLCSFKEFTETDSGSRERSTFYIPLPPACVSSSVNRGCFISMSSSVFVPLYIYIFISSNSASHMWFQNRPENVTFLVSVFNNTCLTRAICVSD